MILHPGLALGLVLTLCAPALAVGQGARPKVSAQEYEGWRQYSVQCARCHGQDVLPNPVAADLLKSAGAGGRMADHGPFTALVKSGRPERGMPGFAKLLSDEQVGAIYAYVKGRADGKIPAGRPEEPEG